MTLSVPCPRLEIVLTKFYNFINLWPWTCVGSVAK